jgi:hypothetical protein
MWHEFAPDNPHRPPSWRWERAGLAAGAGPPLSRSRDDPWVHQGCRFRRLLRNCNDDYLIDSLYLQHPALFRAHQLWELRSEDTSLRLTAHEIEARVLAGCPAETIAARMGISAEVVTAYESLFFDVRPRLEQPSYVFHVVLGQQIHFGLHERNFELIWKFYGYIGGTYVLDAIITTLGANPHPSSADAAIGFGDTALRSQLGRKAMIAVQTLDASRGGVTQTEIVNAYLKLNEIDINRGRAAGTDLWRNNIAAIMESLSWTVSGSPTDDPVRQRIAKIDNGAAELDGKRLMQLGRGETVIDVDLYENATFPERTPAERVVTTEVDL